MKSKPGIMLPAIVCALLLGEIYCLKVLPYSFVEIYYTSETKEFNKASTDDMTVEINGYDFNYRIPHHIKDDRFKELKDLAQENSLSTMDALITIASWVRSKLQFGKPDYYSDEILVDDIINESKHNGLKVLCDSYARLFVIACQSQDLPARIVELEGHVVTEAFINKLGKWIMIDPIYGYYISKDGEPLSVIEIIKYYTRGVTLTPIVFPEEKDDDCLYEEKHEVDLREIYMNGFTVVSDQNIDRKKIQDTILRNFQLPIAKIQFIDAHSTLVGYKEKMLRYAILVTLSIFIVVAIVAFRKRCLKS